MGLKVEIWQSELLTGMNAVVKAVPAKTPLSIQECVLLQAKDGQITLTASSSDLTIKCNVDGEIISDGSCCVDAKSLHSMAKSLPRGKVEIKVNDDTHNCKLRCEKTKFQIPGRDWEGFITPPIVQGGTIVEVPVDVLTNVIRQTIFSTAVASTQLALQGECFEIKNGELRVSALDGHRIARRTVGIDYSGDDIKVVIPRKTLDELSKIIGGATEGSVKMQLADSHAVFTFDGISITSALINDDFFDVDRMLTANYNTSITVNKAEITETLNRATIMISSTDNKPIVVDVKNGNAQLTVKTTKGNFEEWLNLSQDGDDIKIGFNPHFLLDVFKAVEDEDVTINLISDKSPAFIKSEEYGYMYVVLPVQI